MNTSESILPDARVAGLDVEDLDGETMVYDHERNAAHCLNPTAAIIWKHCDGKHSISDIARLLAMDPQVVWYGLGQLDKQHLLQTPITLPDELARITRREFIKRAGLVATTITVPIIASIVAPTPAQAGGCALPGEYPTASRPCCSGIINQTTGQCL
ncbi:MAG: PqqD family protein [Chloroflexi bacterium]|nr:PqqD family protein [Chloroflexota bacterium]